MRNYDMVGPPETLYVPLSCPFASRKTDPITSLHLYIHTYIQHAFPQRSEVSPTAPSSLSSST